MALDFNELKERFLETVGSLADKSAVVARDIGERSTNLAKKTKLNAEIVAEKASLNKTYEELGKKYFEKYGEDYDTDFTEAVMKAKLSLETIDAKNAEIATLKKKKEEKDIEIEVIVEETGDGEKTVGVFEDEAEETDEEKEIVIDLNEKAREVRDAAVQKAGELKEVAKEKLTEAKEATKDFLEKVNANEKVQEAKDATKEFVGKVVDTVSKKADELKTALQNEKEEAAEVVETVEEAAAEKVEEVKEQVEETVEEIKEKTEE